MLFGTTLRLWCSATYASYGKRQSAEMETAPHAKFSVHGHRTWIREERHCTGLLLFNTYRFNCRLGRRSDEFLFFVAALSVAVAVAASSTVCMSLNEPYSGWSHDAR